MAWKIKSSLPVYEQLTEHIRNDIIRGVFAPGEKITAVRDMAVEAAVNPNTMQRAFGELEREGLVITHGTCGRFVTEDRDLIEAARKKALNEVLTEFTERIELLGYTREEAQRALSYGIFD